MELEAAESHLAIAERHRDRAATAAWEPSDPEEAVTWAFYAYENVVMAAAYRAGYRKTRNHAVKVRYASRLVLEGHLRTDVARQLGLLNALRKDVQYGEPGPAMEDTDWVSLVSGLDAYLEEVRAFLGT